MDFETPLIEGKIIKRYKRFFADVLINGKEETAHVPNTGSMIGLKEQGMSCLVSSSNNPKRKLKYTLEMVKATNSWVGVNTQRPNKLVKELFLNQPLDHWKKYSQIKSEVKISKESRLDIALFNTKVLKPKYSFQDFSPKDCHLIEIKNVTLAKGAVALFPDAVTLRGQKHLRDLIELKAKGYATEIVFVIQRTDCKTFAPADEIDPEYGKLLRKAQKSGVLITPLCCSLDRVAINLTSMALNHSF